MTSRVWVCISLLVPASFAVAADDRAKPVTIEVVNAATKQPIAEFSYAFHIVSAKSPARGFKRKGEGNVRSPLGTFEIQAPASCELNFWIESRDSVRGFGHNNFSFVIKSTDVGRKVQAGVELGITVRGIVRDAESKQPIAGAKVAPLIHVVPLYEGDDSRVVIADREGKYELRGVDTALGVIAEHRDYPPPELAMTGPRKVPIGATFDIELRKPERLTLSGVVVGWVRNADGQPLGDVRISGRGRSTFGSTRTDSAPDGSFELQLEGKANDDYFLYFGKLGYIDQSFTQGMPPPARFSVVLEPKPRLEGRVVNHEGRPVESFSVVVGPALNSPGYRSVRGEFRDPTGRFALTLEHPGMTWIGVRAEGFAPWETRIAVDRKGKPLAIGLRAGASVRGRIAAPGGAHRDLRATLSLRRSVRDKSRVDDSAARELAACEAEVAADGSFHFPHIRPDHYVLRIHGPSITASRTLLQVSEPGIDLGVLRFAGTGRIVGTVHRPAKDGGGIWPFAGGTVSADSVPFEEGIDFLADENGRFSVDSVPVGRVSVGIPVQHFDVITDLSWSAWIVEGKATEVHMFDPREERRVAFTFAIGDGSEKQYASATAIGATRKVDNVNAPWAMLAALGRHRPAEPSLKLDLKPDPGERSSFEAPDWDVLDKQRRIILQGVTPGRYHLQVLAFSGTRSLGGEPLFEGNVHLNGGVNPPRIILGAGSITGQIEGGAQAQVFALGSRREAPYRTWSDYHGNFCSRFLPVGTYTLAAHSAEKGWGRGPRIDIHNEIRDVGTIKLVSGGSIRGQIIVRTPSAVPDAIVAVDPSGIELKVPDFDGAIDSEYSLPHLWPGEWTVLLRSRGKTLAKGTVTIEKTETRTVDLVVTPPITP